MKYIKKFNNSSEYEEYALGDMILPNVSYCSDNHKVYYNPLPIHNGYEYVDLGLPSGTKWAKMNVGANSETDYGLYFAWGETTGYTVSQVGTDKQFSLDDYKLTNDGGSTMSKYNTTDGKTMLDLEDDAVHVNWGGEWHIPTKEQRDELLNTTYVTNTWVTDYNGSGINGCLFTSVSNGNTMFIPAAGYCKGGGIEDVGDDGYVWVSALSSNTVKFAWYFYFGRNRIGVSDVSRFYGKSVRGVLDKPKKIINFTIGDKPYQAEDGMTWEQWVNSKYNVVENPYTDSGSVNNGNWWITENHVYRDIRQLYGLFVANKSYDRVLSSDKIIENYAYITMRKLVK